MVLIVQLEGCHSINFFHFFMIMYSLFTIYRFILGMIFRFYNHPLASNITQFVIYLARFYRSRKDKNGKSSGKLNNSFSNRIPFIYFLRSNFFLSSKGAFLQDFYFNSTEAYLFFHHQHIPKLLLEKILHVFFFVCLTVDQR